MKTKLKLSLPGHIHLIGCGGVGSWVAPALVRLMDHRASTLHLWDKDSLELKNLDRQLFSKDHIGKNKASALAELLGFPSIKAHMEYFHDGVFVDTPCLILCCADNHAARKSCLIISDITESVSIISGNEYTDADAYIYVPKLMRNGPNDPRIFAPEIMTSHEGDPLSPRGCTGLAAQLNPQLVLANMAAADHLLRLMWWWFAESSGLDESTMPHWPVMHRTSASRSFTVLMKDRLCQDQLTSTI